MPEAVSIEGSISFADLARSLDVSERILTRILRHAMLNNIFCEPSVGHVAHSSLSLQLARPGNAIRGVVGHQTETVFPAVAHMVDAHDKYGTREENVTRTPFNEAFGTDQGALQWVADDPVRSARFAESMKGGASSGPFSAVHTVRGFDWDALGEGTVVDVSCARQCFLRLAILTYRRSEVQPASSAKPLQPRRRACTSSSRTKHP